MTAEIQLKKDEQKNPTCKTLLGRLVELVDHTGSYSRKEPPWISSAFVPRRKEDSKVADQGKPEGKKEDEKKD